MGVDWRALDGWGFSTFPLLPRDKKPFGPWQKFQTARPSAEQLGNWARRPELNGAVACGEISGVIVLDADSAEAEAEVARRGMPQTPMVRTAKGVHWYLRWPGRRIHNFARKLPGLDLRGDGGYVVAAGSVHPTGVVYQWVTSPEETPIADAPAWLLELIAGLADAGEAAPAATASTVVAGPWKPAEGGNSYAEAAFDKELGKLRRAAAGTRNATLNECAFNLAQLVAGGALDRGMVEQHLRTTAIAIGLTPKEVDATLGSAMKAGAAQPRSAPEPRRRSTTRPSATVSGGPAPAPPPPEDGRANEGGGSGSGGQPRGGGGGRPYTPLGQRGGMLYVIAASGELRAILADRLGPLTILSICNGDPEWLIRSFPRRDRDGQPVNDWNVRAAGQAIMQGCADAGLWDDETVLRGPGVWRRGDGLVVHVGDAVRIGAEGGQAVWQAAGCRIGDAVYPAAPAILRPAAVPAAVEIAREVARDLAYWNFRMPLGRTLVFGWYAAALLGAAPPWRPHVLLTGERGSGKSGLCAYIAAGLGPQGRAANNFTEAGLRQALTGEARALVLDEAEGDSGRVQQVIEMMRLMSGGDGVKGLRGSADHKAHAFSLTGSVCMSAINPPLLEPADRSRITEVDLLPLVDANRAADVVVATERIARDSPALRARAIAGYPRFLHNFAVLRSLLIEAGCDGRQADQLGTLLAAGDMLHNDYPLDTDSARLLVGKAEPLLFRLRAEDDEDGDPRRCLGVLLTTHVDHWQKGQKSTLGRILEHALVPGVDGDQARKALRVYGLRVEVGGISFRERRDGEDVEVTIPGPIMIVASRHEALTRIYRDSRWRDGGWARAFGRLPDARPAPPLWYDGHKARGVIVPAQHLPAPITPSDYEAPAMM